MFVRPILSAAALLAAVGGAHAQGLGSGSAARGDWSGPFVGLAAGAIQSTGEADLEDHQGALLALDVQNGLFPGGIGAADTAAVGGVSLGYDVQRGALVGGVELGYLFAGSEAVAAFSRVDPNPDPIFNGVNTNSGYETALDGLASIRLRVGRDLGGTLVYATAGLAMSRVENRFTLSLPELGYASPDWSESGTRTGYVVGAGIERAVSERLSVRAEIAHYDLEDVTVEARDPATFPGQGIDYRFDNAGTVATVGVTYRF